MHKIMNLTTDALITAIYYIVVWLVCMAIVNKALMLWQEGEGNANEKNETTLAKDGSFSPHIGHKTTARLARYCKLKDLNKTRFVEDCINAQLDILEREALQILSKEELIELYLSKQEG